MTPRTVDTAGTEPSAPATGWQWTRTSKEEAQSYTPSHVREVEFLVQCKERPGPEHLQRSWQNGDEICTYSSWPCSLAVSNRLRREPEAAVERRNIDCGQALARVIVVADGNSGWQGAAANGVVEELKAGLDSCHELRVARFDAEPQLHFGFTVEGDNRDLIEVRPHTPMAEVMEWAFNFLMDTPRPRTMVVIAHEQFYPSHGFSSALARVGATL